MEALQDDGAHVKLEAAKKSKKRYPHGYYCVCGCRALHEGEIQYIKSQKKIYSIFPRLSAKQLKSQAMGGGKASQMAVQQRNTMQETRYQPANLVPDQPRMASREEVPLWSMLQVNYRREEVTGRRVSPKVGRLRHQTEEAEDGRCRRRSPAPRRQWLCRQLLRTALCEGGRHRRPASAGSAVVIVSSVFGAGSPVSLGGPPLGTELFSPVIHRQRAPGRSTRSGNTWPWPTGRGDPSCQVLSAFFSRASRGPQRGQDLNSRPGRDRDRERGGGRRGAGRRVARSRASTASSRRAARRTSAGPRGARRRRIKPLC